MVLAVDVVDFAPDLVSDLSVGGSGGDYDGFVVCHEPPDDGERGGVGLAGAFGRIDCDPVVPANGVEDLPLLVSERHAESLGDEPVGLASPFGAFARCGGVGHGWVSWMRELVAAPLPWFRSGLGALGVVFSTFVVGEVKWVLSEPGWAGFRDGVGWVAANVAYPFALSRYGEN